MAPLAACLWRRRLQARVGDGGSGRKRLGDGGALEQAHGVALGEAVEAVGLAAGADVQVDVVARGGGGDYGIVQVLLAHGLELVGDALVGGEARF